MYEHAVHMSFPFFDRVQTGQLISRANSDIRSVQMYLTFAPNILVQCAIAVVAFVYMVQINLGWDGTQSNYKQVSLKGIASNTRDLEIDLLPTRTISGRCPLQACV